MDFYVNEDTAWLRKAVRWTVNVVLVLASAWFLVYGFCTQVPVAGRSLLGVSTTCQAVPCSRF